MIFCQLSSHDLCITYKDLKAPEKVFKWTFETFCRFHYLVKYILNYVFKKKRRYDSLKSTISQKMLPPAIFLAGQSCCISDFSSLFTLNIHNFWSKHLLWCHKLGRFNPHKKATLTSKTLNVWSRSSYSLLLWL